MLKSLKKKLYFFVAFYFRFFAQIQLNLWKPRIIVVTGSSGKTTLLHLIESQLGEKARYSHHANSMFGISFDILGLRRKNLIVSEWFFLFLAAPFRAFKKPFKQKLYIVEVDCDRPGEGKFLATLLNPEVTLWINSSRTHSVNFDYLIAENKFSTVEEAIAHEFGFLLEYTKSFVIVNADSQNISSQLKRTKARTILIRKDQLNSYKVTDIGAEFVINNTQYKFNFLLPEETFYLIGMTAELVRYLNLKFDPTFSNFSLPPGRSSIFRGIKNTTIIDSSYNATPDGVAVILEMFKLNPAINKWLVLGDMLELGKQEKEEHEKLAEKIMQVNASKVILIGPRVSKYTFPKLDSAVKFEFPKDGLEYILANISGGETILFKGARFLEGVIENLLADKNDIAKLCRRELIWQKRREEWGL